MIPCLNYRLLHIFFRTICLGIDLLFFVLRYLSNSLALSSFRIRLKPGNFCLVMPSISYELQLLHCPWGILVVQSSYCPWSHQLGSKIDCIMMDDHEGSELLSIFLHFLGSEDWDRLCRLCLVIFMIMKNAFVYKMDLSQDNRCLE